MTKKINQTREIKCERGMHVRSRYVPRYVQVGPFRVNSLAVLSSIRNYQTEKTDGLVRDSLVAAAGNRLCYFPHPRRYFLTPPSFSL